MTTENKTITAFRHGRIICGVWKNESQTGTFYTMTPQRRRKKQQGEGYDYFTSFSERDRKDLIRCTEDFEEFVAEQAKLEPSAT